MVDIALIILSCDKYSELWDSLSETFQQNWPDCPFDKFLVTNNLDYRVNGFNILKTGNDITWSGTFLKSIAGLTVNYKYVLLALDDLFLSERVDTNRLMQLIKSFIDNDGNYLSLIQTPKYTRKFNECFGEIEPGALYRTTCVFALWKIEVVLDLIVPEESAWEFERKGSVRSQKFGKFYGVYERIFEYHNVVVRGKIVRKVARKYNLGFAGKLTVMSVWENFVFYCRFYVFKMLLVMVPWNLQAKLVNIWNFIKCK